MRVIRKTLDPYASELFLGEGLKPGREEYAQLFGASFVATKSEGTCLGDKHIWGEEYQQKWEE